MEVQPYLFFNGKCQEALDFYKRALGAEVMMVMRFKESPDSLPPEKAGKNWGDKIMHACFRIGETQVMASDGRPESPSSFQNFSLSLAVANQAEADRFFNALTEGGKVQMPLGKTFWSPRFGMVTDRFGLGWMVSVVDEKTKVDHKSRSQAA